MIENIPFALYHGAAIGGYNDTSEQGEGHKIKYNSLLAAIEP